MLASCADEAGGVRRWPMRLGDSTAARSRSVGTRGQRWAPWLRRARALPAVRESDVCWRRRGRVADGRASRAVPTMAGCGRTASSCCATWVVTTPSTSRRRTTWRSTPRSTGSSRRARTARRARVGRGHRRIVHDFDAGYVFSVTLSSFQPHGRGAARRQPDSLRAAGNSALGQAARGGLAGQGPLRPFAARQTRRTCTCPPTTRGCATFLQHSFTRI